MRVCATTIRAFLVAVAVTAAVSAAPLQEATALLETIRQQYHLPGMAWVVVTKDRIVESGAIGIRKLKSPELIMPEDRFHLGSNTKAMTATVIAMAVEDGTLSWTSRPLDVFPELEDTIDPAYRDITLADLLRHRAGIPPYSDTESPEFKAFRKSGLISGSPVQQRHNLSYWVLRHKPAVQPGSKALYSNAGVVIAAAMVEQATVESWESMMQRRLFEPLHIHGGFDWPAMDDPQQPWGHLPSGKSFKPHDPRGSYHLVTYLSPAGAVQMNMADYGRFLEMHLQGLAGKDTLVKASTMQVLHTPVDVFALGWEVSNESGVETHSHSGSAGTFFVTVKMWPARGLAIAVATNAGGDTAAKACKEAIDALFRRN